MEKPGPGLPKPPFSIRRALHVLLDKLADHQDDRYYRKHVHPLLSRKKRR